MVCYSRVYVNALIGDTEESSDDEDSDREHDK